MDKDKAEKLNCTNCSVAEQALRNCSGKGSPAKVDLNGKIFTRCPKATFLEQLGIRNVVNAYFTCIKHEEYPSPGGMFEQTAWCAEVFEYLDLLVEKQRERNAKRTTKK